MNRRAIFASLFVIQALKAISVLGQTTHFTHHGNIGLAANGNGYDIQLTLFDTPTVGTGTPQGSTFQQLGVQMTDGEFIVQPDFGAAAFTGAELYLETGWRASALRIRVNRNPNHSSAIPARCDADRIGALCARSHQTR